MTGPLNKARWAAGLSIAGLDDWDEKESPFGQLVEESSAKVRQVLPPQAGSSGRLDLSIYLVTIQFNIGGNPLKVVLSVSEKRENGSKNVSKLPNGHSKSGQKVLGPVDPRDVIYTMTRAVGSLVVRASDSRPEGLGSMLDVTKYPPSAHGFTCRNCGGGDRGRVAIYRPFGEVSLSLNRTVTYMVLKANDRRTSCPCHDEFRGPRSDYVRQNQLVLSDESSFNLSSVRRPRGERLNPAFALQLHTSPTAVVMVWGTIAYNARPPPSIDPWHHDSPEMFLWHPATTCVTTHATLPGATFQQDNALPHTARVSHDCLRTFTTFYWPARSSEFSPIQHIWDYLGRRVGHPRV
ncbi:transposable element Tcb2 transposase [Trichonephila clavipes]|nr:transposable element Tcb2 transposase [Trichonephila clavipes]